MENKSLAALLDPFRSSEVLGVEVAIRREDGEFRLVVACRSSRKTVEIEGQCTDDDCTDTLNRLIDEAVTETIGTFARPMVRQSTASAHASASAMNAVKKLSERENEVLRLVAEGDSNKKIGMKLGISVHTVNAHRVSIMSKLDIHDAQGLTRFAAQNGLIDVHRR
jgi:DNA-binding NarL/FixJ family response regulator